MSYIDRFIYDAPETWPQVQADMQRVTGKIEKLTAEQLAPYGWDDEGYSGQLEKDQLFKWVSVPDPRASDTPHSLEVAAMVTEDEGTTRYFALVGKQADGTFRNIGYMLPSGRLEGGAPYNLILSMRDHEYDTTYIPWESADAQIFLKLAEPALDALS